MGPSLKVLPQVMVVGLGECFSRFAMGARWQLTLPLWQVENVLLGSNGCFKLCDFGSWSCERLALWTGLGGRWGGVEEASGNIMGAMACC